MGIKHQPFAKTEMLIRRPVAEVFEAFVNPAITSKFWFTKASGRLESGKQIRWDWEMYDLSLQVNVKTIERMLESSPNGRRMARPQRSSGSLRLDQTAQLL